MRIERTAVAGSLESCDALVTVEPFAGRENRITLEGVSVSRFGEMIRCAVNKTLDELGVEFCSVKVQDRGALDCTIRARLNAAIRRGSTGDRDIPWEVLK